jgi:hypothetical protein
MATGNQEAYAGSAHSRNKGVEAAHWKHVTRPKSGVSNEDSRNAKQGRVRAKKNNAHALGGAVRRGVVHIDRPVLHNGQTSTTAQ